MAGKLKINTGIIFQGEMWLLKLIANMPKRVPQNIMMISRWHQIKTRHSDDAYPGFQPVFKSHQL